MTFFCVISVHSMQHKMQTHSVFTVKETSHHFTQGIQVVQFTVLHTALYVPASYRHSTGFGKFEDL